MKPSQSVNASPLYFAALLVAVLLSMACGGPPPQQAVPPGPSGSPPPASSFCVPWDGQSRAYPAGALGADLGGDPCRATLAAGPSQATAWVSRTISLPTDGAAVYLYVEGTLSRAGTGSASVILSSHAADGSLAPRSNTLEGEVANGRSLLSSDFIRVPGDQLLAVEVFLQSGPSSPGFSVRLDPLVLSLVSSADAQAKAAALGRKLQP